MNVSALLLARWRSLMKRLPFSDGAVAIWLVCLASLMFVYMVYGLSSLYFQHDAYYYLAIAESLLSSGEMLDATNIPSLPVVSPQNGIVFIIALLKTIGISSNIDVLFFISVINYCFFVWFCYLVYKIYCMFGVERHFSLVVASSIILSLFYARIYIQSINDPIFITLTTFVFYLILQKKENWKTLCLLVFCALVLSEFRISGVLVFLSAALTYFYFKKVKMGMFFIGLTILTYVIQAVLSEAFIINQEGISALKDYTLGQYSVHYFLHNMWHTFKVNIPEALLAYARSDSGIEIKLMPLYVFISGIVLVGYFRLLKNALLLKEFNSTYLAIYVAAYICFLQLFFVLNTRYILPIAPFLTLVLFLQLIKGKQGQKFFSYMLLILSVIILVFIPPDDLRSKEGLSKAVFFERMGKALQGMEYEVLSSNKYSARVNYLLLHKASFTDARNIKGNKVLIVGSDLFCVRAIRQLTILKGNEDANIKRLESYVMYNGAKVQSYLVEWGE